MPGKGPERETDPNTTYRDWMSRYVDESRAAGAVPILVTSMTRRNFRDGRIVTPLGDYAQAVRDLARDKDVLLIDLHASSIELLNRLGPAESDTLGPIVDGRPDRTHLSAKRQAVMAAVIAALLREAVPELAPHSIRVSPAVPPRDQPGETALVSPGMMDQSRQVAGGLRLCTCRGPVLPVSAIRRVPNARARHVRLVFG